MQCGETKTSQKKSERKKEKENWYSKADVKIENVNIL